MSVVLALLYVAKTAGLAFAYSIALYGAGGAVLASVSAKRDLRTEIAYSWPIGLGVYSLFWIVLALFGLLRPAFTVPLLGVGIAIFVLRKPWRGAAEALPALHAELIAAGKMWVAAVVALFVLFVLLGLCAYHPPAGDAVAFYMAWAKVIGASGYILPLVGYEAFSTIWAGAEVNFAVMMALGGESAAKLLAWHCLVAAAFAIWKLAAECGCGAKGATVAVAILLTSSCVTAIAWDGKTDLLAVAPGLAAVYWAIRRPATYRTDMLAGFLAGTALSIKLSYIPALGAAMFAALAYLNAADIRAGRIAATWRAFVGRLGVIGAVALLVVLPQTVKNYVQFNEPFAPLLWLTGQASYVTDIWFAAGTIKRLLLTYPIALTFGRYWGQHGTLSPLAFGLLPLLACALVRRAPANAELKAVALAAVAGLAAWMIVAPSQIAPRYFLAALLLVAIPVGWAGAWAAASRFRSVVVSIPAAIVAMCAVTTVSLLPVANVAAHQIRALSDPGGFKWRDHGQLLADIIGDRARPGDRVAFLGYYRYFLRADLLQCLVSPGRLGPPMPENLRNLGIRFIYHEKNIFTSWHIDPQALSLDLLYDDTNYVIWEVKALDSTPPTERCVELSPGYWRIEHVAND